MAYPIGGKIYAGIKQKEILERAEQLYQGIMTEEAESDIIAQNQNLQSVFAALESGSPSGSNESTRGSDSEPAVPMTEKGVPATTTISQSNMTVMNGDFLGQLFIDKINVEYPVVEGVEPQNLEIFLGHMPSTSPIGELGNTVIAGHRSHNFGWYFNRLDELVKDDFIVIEAKGNRYTYKVYDKLVVEPTDTSVLRRSSSRSVLTLMTCHPLYTSKQRLVVHAVLVDLEKI